MSTYPLSLAPLSVLPRGPIEQIDAAAAAGFEMTGMRLLPVSPTDPEILPDASLRRSIVQRLADTGVKVLDIEVFRVHPALDVSALAPALEFGADLRAKYLLCTLPLHAEGTRDGEDATVEKLVHLCDAAAAHGLRPMLEFMKYRLMGSLADARRIVAKAAHPNLGICVDALHLARAGGTPADVREVEPSLLSYLQLCDAPAAEPPENEIPLEARYHRLAPGAGGLPLLELLQAMPPQIPLSLEVPDSTQAAMDATAIAKHLASTTRALIERMHGSGQRR